MTDPESAYDFAAKGFVSSPCVVVLSLPSTAVCMEREEVQVLVVLDQIQMSFQMGSSPGLRPLL